MISSNIMLLLTEAGFVEEQFLDIDETTATISWNGVPPQNALIAQDIVLIELRRRFMPDVVELLKSYFWHRVGDDTDLNQLIAKYKSMITKYHLPADDIFLQSASTLRHALARQAARNVDQLCCATGDQVANYIDQQITNGISKATALANFDAAGTFAAVKPILRNMLVGIYATVDILKLMGRIDVAFRDELWPDMPDS